MFILDLLDQLDTTTAIVESLDSTVSIRPEPTVNEAAKPGQPNLWGNPAVIAAFISAAVAFVGALLTFFDNRKKHKETLLHNKQVLESTNEMNTNMLKHQKLEMENSRLNERKKFLYKKLNEFYIPITNYLNSSKDLYGIFMAGKPDSSEFRVLNHLLNPERIYSNGEKVVLTNSERVILGQIFDIGNDVIKLIDSKGGLIDDRELTETYIPDPNITDIEFDEEKTLLSLTRTHFRIIKLAYEGALADSPDVDKYEKFVYPRELNSVLAKKTEEIKSEIEQIDQEIGASI